MQTVKTDPLSCAVHYYYHALEWNNISDTISISLLMALVKGSGIHSKLAVLHKHPQFHNFCSLVHFFFPSHFILYKSTYCFTNILSQEMTHLKSYTIYPSDPNWRHLPWLDSASPLQNSVQGQQILEFQFRLQHDYFTQALTGMNFVDNNSVKMLQVGNSGHHNLIRVDTALMILMSHLAFLDLRIMLMSSTCPAFESQKHFMLWTTICSYGTHISLQTYLESLRSPPAIPDELYFSSSRALNRHCAQS